MSNLCIPGAPVSALRNVCQILVLTLASVCLSTVVTAADIWPQFGNNSSHTGHQPGLLGFQEPFLIWDSEITSPANGLNSIVVSDDRVFVTPNDLGIYFLVALDARSGDRVWKYNFEHASSISPPSFANGAVYVQRVNGTRDSDLWSLDAAAGSVNWTESFDAQSERYYAPTIADGTVFMGGGEQGGLYGFDQASGEQLFFDDELPRKDLWTPLYHQGSLYTWVGGTFREHDARTGKVLQRLEIEESGSSSQHAVAVADNGIAYLQGDSILAAVNLSSFDVLWQSTVNVKGTPAVADGLVYVLELYAIHQFDAASGDLLRSFESDELLTLYSQPLITDDRVIVSTATQVHIIDRFTMNLVHSIGRGGHVALASNVLYIADKGNVSAWGIGYREKELDEGPFVTVQIPSVSFERGIDNLTVDLAGLFSDPDDDDSEIYLTVHSNSNPSLVAAKIIDNQLILDFGDFAGYTDLEIKGNSYGMTAIKKVTISVIDPDIEIELFNSAGEPVLPGETVSGVITGKATLKNKMGQHAQFYQNFRVLHVHEHGHMIDSNNWVRTFSVDTANFFDGENLISLHVHPHNVPGQPYLASFDVGSIKINSVNGNPSPDGDTQLPEMDISPDKIVVNQALRVPGHELSMLRDAIIIEDDFGPIDIDHFSHSSDKAQVIPHLGASVLGRFRWADRDPPFGDSPGQFFEGVTLLNFQREVEFNATLVFFFNDAAGRANYGFHSFTMPALAASDRRGLTLPSLDAEFLNAHQGDDIVVTEEGGFTLKVKVTNLDPLVDEFPLMSTWVGNRSVAVTDLEPLFEAMPPGQNSLTVDVTIPAEEIRKLQDTRNGGQDTAAFALWTDFTLGNFRNLPASEHVHLTTIRTESLLWPYGLPTVDLKSPDAGDILKGEVQVKVLVSGDFSNVEGLYIQFNDETPVRVEEFVGQQGLFDVTLGNLARNTYTLSTFFLDAFGNRLAHEGGTDNLTFTLQNDRPVAVVDHYSLNQNQSVSANAAEGLLSNDKDLESDDLTVSQVVRLTSHGLTTWAPDGSFTYTPKEGFVGIDRLYYTANDGFENSNVSVAVFSVSPETYLGVPSDKLTFGNDPTNSGYHPGFVGLQSPAFRWRKTVSTPEDPLNSVAMANGQVFLTAHTPTSGNILMALNSDTGDEIWRYGFPESGTLNPPAYGDRKIYVQRGNHSKDSQLWSIDAFSGNLLWTSPFTAQWERYYAPMLTEGKVFTIGGYSPGLLGFDQTTGARLFAREGLAPGGLWAPLYHNGRLYTWVLGRFREHDIVSGQIVRSVEIGHSSIFTISQNIRAAASDGIAFLQATDFLTAVNLSDFSILWQAPVSQKGTPAVSHSLVYVIQGNEVLQIDGLSGETLGTFQAAEPLTQFSQPLLTNDSLIVSSSDTVYLVNRFTMELMNFIDEGGYLGIDNDSLFIAGNGSVSAWQIAFPDSVSIPTQETAYFDPIAEELHLPLVRIELLDPLPGASTFAYFKDIKLKIATECGSIILRPTAATPVAASELTFLQGDRSNAISYYSDYTGVLNIPRIDLMSGVGDGASVEASYESVRSYISSSCPGVFMLSGATLID